MPEYRSRRRDRPQERQPKSDSGEGIRFLLCGEERLLQSISACVPLPEVLNDICSALDGQIGNVVSLVCLREDDANILAAITGNSRHYGLYTFCSAGIFSEKDELLGSFEVFCCGPRIPTPEEFQVIERAKCLAAIAIKRSNEVGDVMDCRIHGHRPVRGYVLEMPESMN